MNVNQLYLFVHLFFLFGKANLRFDSRKNFGAEKKSNFSIRYSYSRKNFGAEQKQGLNFSIRYSYSRKNFWAEKKKAAELFYSL